MNLNEWEGVAGQPAKSVGRIDYDRFATFDEDQAANAVKYIQEHANDDKPFFMDVNYLKMHNPTNAAPDFAGKSHLGDYSDSLMELDADIGKVMDEIRKDAPEHHRHRHRRQRRLARRLSRRRHDAVPRREGLAVRGRLAGARHHVVARPYPGARQVRRDDVAYRRLGDAGRPWSASTPPPHEWVGNDGKPIYFDSIDNSAYILGKAEHSARRSWIYIDGEIFQGARADIGGDPKEPWVNIAWKYLYTARDSWLGVKADLGAIGATYNLTMDPYEKYDMTFNGAAPSTVRRPRRANTPARTTAGSLALIAPVMIEFDKTIMKFPNIRRFVGGASTDLVPNLQDPERSGPAAEEADREARRAARRRRRRLIVRSLHDERRGGLGRPFRLPLVKSR